MKIHPTGNAISAFAVAFVVRPFEALFFGRIGDVVGGKHAFVATLMIMGGATAAIGLLPTFQTAGWMAPVTLIVKESAEVARAVDR